MSRIPAGPHNPGAWPHPSGDTHPSATSLPEKAIQPGESATIAANGLRCFPIHQTYGRDADGFDYAASSAPRSAR